MSRSSPPTTLEHADLQQQSPAHLQDNVMFQPYAPNHNGVLVVQQPIKSNPSMSPSSTCYRAPTATPASPGNISGAASPNQNSIALSAHPFVPSEHHNNSGHSAAMTMQSDRGCQLPPAVVASAANNTTTTIITSNATSLAPINYCDSTSVVRSLHPFMEHHNHNDNLRSSSPVVVTVAHSLYNNRDHISSSGGVAYGSGVHDYLHAPSSYLHHSQMPSAEWIAAENGDTSSILAAAVAKAELDPMSYQQQHPYQSVSETIQHRGILATGGSASTNIVGNGVESWAPWPNSTMLGGGNSDHPSGDEMSQGHHMSDSMDHRTSPVSATLNPIKPLQQQPTSSSTNGKCILCLA